MPNVLVVYASTHGHTGRIAERICEVLRTAGLGAEARRLTGAGAAADLDGVDAVVVGASVHAGHHQTEVVDWVRAHEAALGGMPTALFSVSLTAADPEPGGQDVARGYADELLDDTGWDPQEVRCFAGALQYLEYGFMTRLLVRLIASQKDLPTDVHHDVDLTDWDAVEAFAREVAALVTPAVAR